MTRGKERGFTLIELVVSITILAIIGSVITQALIIGLRTTDNTSQKLGESSDALVLASYFGSDAQSATDVSTTDTACGGVTPVVRLSWTDPGATAPGLRVVSYAVVGGALVRRSCLNGGAASQQTVVRDVTAASCACSPPTLSLSVTAGGFTYQLDGRKRGS